MAESAGRSFERARWVLRAWWAGLALSLAATSCSSSAGPAASSTGETPPSSAANTSTAPTTSTTAPPLVVIPEEEWVSTIETMMERLVTANEDPPNADIASFCVPDSECWSTYESYFGNLEEDGNRVVGLQPTWVQSIDEVVDASTLAGKQHLPPDTMYQVTYTLAPAQPGGQLVDADGNVLETAEEPDPNPMTRTRLFSRFPDDPEAPWRYVDF